MSADAGAASPEAGYRANDGTRSADKFPPTFYYANTIDFFERLGFYGLYIGLAIYLHKVVGMSDIEVGFTLGNFRLVASLAPIPSGAIADRIGFKRSLLASFVGFATAYGAILFFPQKGPVVGALMLVAVSSGLMKPAIMATVVRTSPPERQAEGFSIFYRVINAGSATGKTLAYVVRRLVGVRFVVATSIVTSLVALATTALGYDEPPKIEKKGSGPAFGELMRGYADALKNPRFAAFLLIVSGFYFMLEQFYMTFPQYMTRHIDDKVPLELITLLNPVTIVIAGGFISRTVARWMQSFSRIATNVLGVFLGAFSMLVMGLFPSIGGACLAAAIFAAAEITFVPAFYDQLGRMAPPGKAGMYMGLTFVPIAIGAWFGGQVSGHLIARYLPEQGERSPLVIWASYAALGLLSAAALAIFAKVNTRPRLATSEAK